MAKISVAAATGNCDLRHSIRSRLGVRLQVDEMGSLLVIARAVQDL
jgi:hypothetical protein